MESSFYIFNFCTRPLNSRSNCQCGHYLELNHACVKVPMKRDASFLDISILKKTLFSLTAVPTMVKTSRNFSVSGEVSRQIRTDIKSCLVDCLRSVCLPFSIKFIDEK